MKAVVAAFNQEKALVGAFSMIVQPVVEPMEHCTALVLMDCRDHEGPVMEGQCHSGEHKDCHGSGNLIT